MKLSKSQKIGIGIITFMPILCFIGYIISFVFIIMGTFNDISPSSSVATNQEIPAHFTAGIGIAMIFMLLLLISGLVSLIIHIIHVTKNQKLKNQNNGQLIWILVIILANGIGGIVYYFMEILPEPKDPILPSEN
jgi:amino acid transporter